jgi:4-hydroxy-3-polyprenylbenzoate decarboxylase
MAYKSLNHFIQALESAGELVRIKQFVSPNLEITEITDRVVKNNGKALLFENTGTDFPLLINAFGSERRICMALGIDHLDDIGRDIEHLLKEFMGPKATFLDKLKVLPTLNSVASWMPKTVHGKGACQEVRMENPDLSKLPVLTCWPADGGPFITFPLVHTMDPETGIRNLGMYRMQVFGADLTGMHWHLHKGSAHHYLKYKKLGKRMPVAVTLGGDPAYTYSATAPLPENIDEYMFAGFLRKKRVEMVRCLTNELYVAADADFVIEGFVDSEEELIFEGPFGDHTGFYSLADFYPRFHVTCITHRKDAIYPTTIVGIPPMEDGWIGKATERIFLMPMRMTVVPELKDINMPVEGVFHNIVITKIQKTYAGQGLKVMSSLWGAGQMMFNKIMVAVDRDIRVDNYRDLARVITETVDPLSDVHFIKGPVDVLDHSSSRFSYGSKMGIDATDKLPEEKEEVEGVLSQPSINEELILSQFPEVTAINSQLLKENISAVIVSVFKNRKGHLKDMAAQWVSMNALSGIKFIVFMDSGIDVAAIGQVVWVAANNIDPMRDCFKVETGTQTYYPGLFVDGTRKTLSKDQFKRDWPNVIVMDDRIIGKIDDVWESLKIGPFLPSPSHTYKPLVDNGGAVHEPLD